MSFELSPAYRHASPAHSHFSACSSLHVTCHNDIVVLRDVTSANILKTWSIPTTITKPTSSINYNTITTLLISPAPPFLILAHIQKSGLIYVFHPEEAEMVSTLVSGDEECSGLCWSGNGESIMVWNSLNTKITIHPIDASSSPLVINAPKLSFPAGYSFKPTDPGYLAIVERNQANDQVAVYDSASWKLLRTFKAPTSADLAGIKWSPCGKYIAIWESILDYILHIYTPDGRHLSTFSPYASISPAIQITSRPAPLKSKSKLVKTVDGKQESLGVKDEMVRKREENSTADFVGLGIRKVEWSEDGNYLAIGGWDGVIRILRKSSWSVVAEMSTPDKIASSAIKVWREPKDWLEKSRGYGIVSFEAQELPFNSPSIRPEKVVNPKMGIAELSWSASGRWIASFNQMYPTTIWIYTFPSPTTSESESSNPTPRLHTVLTFLSPIKTLQWSSIPTLIEEGVSAEVDCHFKDLLLIASGNQSFGIWTEVTAEKKKKESPAEGVAITIPSKSDFSLKSIKLSDDGKSILLSDNDIFLLAYPI